MVVYNHPRRLSRPRKDISNEPDCPGEDQESESRDRPTLRGVALKPVTDFLGADAGVDKKEENQERRNESEVVEQEGSNLRREGGTGLDKIGYCRQIELSRAGELHNGNEKRRHYGAEKKPLPPKPVSEK